MNRLDPRRQRVIPYSTYTASVELLSAPHAAELMRLQAERDQARAWAKAWKRLAKSERAYYSGQGDYLHEVAEARDDYKDLSATYRRERDSARRVARALWLALRRARQFECAVPGFLPPNQFALGQAHSSLDAAWTYFKQADANARRVISEEAKK